MNYGYMRVSTDKQDTENQRGAILEYANAHKLGHINEFISETISSRKSDRVIYRLIDKLAPGDNLVIFELSRLARSMTELESIRVKIAEKSATIHAISQNLIISPNSDDITTQALIFAFSISAQLERQMISDRTKSALQARKGKGLPLGRPAGKSKLDEQREAIQGYLDKGLNLTAISKLIDCNRQTLANWLKDKN
jgi:putative DNA-invertase from lambdoid prophage Rac